MSDRRQDRTYQVPRRFGIGTILVVMALFATLCGVIKWTELRPIGLVMYSSFVIVIGAAQVIFARSPRLGSILAGALFLPFSMFVVLVIEEGASVSGGMRSMPVMDGGLVFWILVTGAVLGYVGGTVLAGVFLVLENLQLALQRGHRQGGMTNKA